MNSKLTLNSVKINEGRVARSERPVFVGLSGVSDSTNGRNVQASVTIDRDWLWVRFSSTPSETWRSKLTTQGFTYSRKREGWHVQLHESKLEFVRSLGALPVTSERVAFVQALPDGEFLQVSPTETPDPVDLDAEPESKRHSDTKSRVMTRRSNESKPEPTRPKSSQRKQDKVATPQYEELMATIAKQQATIERLTELVAKLAG